MADDSSAGRHGRRVVIVDVIAPSRYHESDQFSRNSWSVQIHDALRLRDPSAHWVVEVRSPTRNERFVSSPDFALGLLSVFDEEPRKPGGPDTLVGQSSPEVVNPLRATVEDVLRHYSPAIEPKQADAR